METEFRNINLCMSRIKEFNNKISNLKGKLRILNSVLDKESYIQETITVTIGGDVIALSVATCGGTDVKRGAEMVMLGIKKMLNAKLEKLEQELISSKNALVVNAKEAAR